MAQQRTLKILLVEDDVELRNAYRRVFRELDPTYEVHFADEVEEALEELARNPDFSAITVDGQLRGPLKGMDFAKRARATYVGPMFACSAVYNQELLKAGCDHVIEHKSHLPRQVHAFLAATKTATDGG